MDIPSILLAVLIFGGLIFVHELGHFLVAKWCGVRILEFSVGMGPKLLSKKSRKSGTVYSWRLLPFGGYVNMQDEEVEGEEVRKGNGTDLLINEKKAPSLNDALEKAKKEEEATHFYSNQPVWKRLLISFAGPLMNLLLGFLLMLCMVLSAGKGAVGTTQVHGFYVVYQSEIELFGFQQGDYLESVDSTPLKSFSQLKDFSDVKPHEVTVLRQNEAGSVERVSLKNVVFTSYFTENHLAHSLSEDGGLLPEDVILKVGNVRVSTYHELSYEIMNQGYRSVNLTVKRDGKSLVLQNVTFPNSVDAESGVAFGEMDFLVYGESEFNLPVVLKHTFFRSVSTVKMAWDSILGLLSGRYGVQAVSGPVGITKTISDVAQTGAINLLYLVIVISVNLGVTNLLPLPALDGGHIFFYLLEVVRGRPVKKEVEAFVNFAGMVLLIFLAIIIAIKDVISL